MERRTTSQPRKGLHCKEKWANFLFSAMGHLWSQDAVDTLTTPLGRTLTRTL